MGDLGAGGPLCSCGKKKALDVGGPSSTDLIYFWGSNKKQRSCDGRWGGRAAPRLAWQWAQKDGCAQRTGAHARPKLTSLSYIYLGSSVCHPVCHPVIFLSSCHSCGTLSYSLCFSNQTDQGDEREGFEREGYRWRDRRWGDWRGRLWRDFSLLKAQRKKNVGSQCHLQLLCWTI